MEIHWDSLAERDWRRLSNGAAMQQDWSYGSGCAVLGSKVLRAEIRAGGEIAGLAQLIHRRFLGAVHAVVCTRGPVWCTTDAETQADALRALRRALPLPMLRGLFATPDTQDPRAVLKAGLNRVMTPYATAVLDLRQPPEALRAAMHQKWRNRLGAAERAGLTVRRADKRPAHYAWLLAYETVQQRTKRYAALPPALVPAWQAAGGDLRVYVATQDRAPVAAMLFLVHGLRATYHIGWANAEGRKSSAHNLLLWTAMRRLARAGVMELDLGGLNTQDAPGLARFKLGSGAELRTLCGTWFGGTFFGR